MGDRDGIFENGFLKKQSVKHQRESNPRLGYISMQNPSSRRMTMSVFNAL